MKMALALLEITRCHKLYERVKELLVKDSLYSSEKV